MKRTYLVVMLITFPAVVQAETIEVDTIVDLIMEDGECGLREAILSANTDTSIGGCPAGRGADTIVLPEGFFELTLSGQAEDEGRTGDLDVDSDLTIQGAGRVETIVDARGLDRVLQIHGVATVVTLRELAIRGGAAPNGGAGGPGEDGGGIWCAGELTIERCDILGNQAGNGGDGLIWTEDFMPRHGVFGGLGGRGGGIFLASGGLNLQETVVCGNRAGRGGTGGRWDVFSSASNGGEGGSGGGIYALEQVVSTDSTLCNNTSGHGGAGGYGLFHGGGNGRKGGQGGGLYSAVRATLSDCLFENNAAGEGGDAGNAVDSSSGTAGDGGDGGAVFAVGELSSTGNVVRSNHAGDGGSTPGNVWSGGRAGWGGSGGGLYLQTNRLATIDETTIEDNSAGDGGRPVVVSGILGVPPPPHTRSGGHGGGLYLASNARLLMMRSAVLRNRSGDGADGTWDSVRGGNGGHGGGIVVEAQATATLRSSTLSLNSAGAGGHGGGGEFCGFEGGHAGSGGAIYNFGIVGIADVTIFDNHIASPGQGGGGHDEDCAPPEGNPGQGGGLATGGTLTAVNSIFAGNRADESPDCVTMMQATFTSADHNLIGDPEGCVIVGETEHDLQGDPGLAAATDNGGPTHTCAPEPDSQVLESGSLTCLPTDQRGLQRPVGLACEIGAYEDGIVDNARDDEFVGREDEALEVPAPGVLGNDTMEDPTAELIEGPLHGQLTLEADGAFVYLPDENFFGSDGFTYQTLGLTADVSIDVEPVVDAPTITAPPERVSQLPIDVSWSCVEDALGHAQSFRLEVADNEALNTPQISRLIEASGEEAGRTTLEMLEEGSWWLRVIVITGQGEAASDPVHFVYSDMEDPEPDPDAGVPDAETDADDPDADDPDADPDADPDDDTDAEPDTNDVDEHTTDADDPVDDTDAEPDTNDADEHTTDADDPDADPVDTDAEPDTNDVDEHTTDADDPDGDSFDVAPDTPETDDEEGNPPPPDGDNEGEGCTIASGSRGGPGGLLVFLLLFVWARSGSNWRNSKTP